MEDLKHKLAILIMDEEALEHIRWIADRLESIQTGREWYLRDLELPSRVRGVMTRAYGNISIDELRKIRRSELLKLRGMGNVGVEIVITAIDEFCKTHNIK